MWDVTNFKTRDTYGFDEMYIAAKHRPIVQFYVDSIRPLFAVKYNPDRYSPSVQGDQHERGLFLRSNGLRYEDFGAAFAALTKQHIGKRITLTRWRMIAATAADEHLDTADRKVMDAADSHSFLTANHYYVKRTKQETVRRSVQLFKQLKEKSLAGVLAPSTPTAAATAASAAPTASTPAAASASAMSDVSILALSSSSASAPAGAASAAGVLAPDSDPDTDSGSDSDVPPGSDQWSESDDDALNGRTDGTIMSLPRLRSSVAEQAVS
jgi:hypothetical protein